VIAVLWIAYSPEPADAGPLRSLLLRHAIGRPVHVAITSELVWKKATFDVQDDLSFVARRRMAIGPERVGCRECGRRREDLDEPVAVRAGRLHNSRHGIGGEQRGAADCGGDSLSSADEGSRAMTGAREADVDVFVSPTSDTVVSYERFLEIRERRARILAELRLQSVASPPDDLRSAVVIDWH